MVFLFWIFWFLHNTNAEYFTSSSHLRALLDSEQVLAGKLHEYISGEERRLSKLKNIYDRIKYLEKLHTPDNVKKHIGNPLEASRTLRRYVKLWPKVRSQSLKSKENDFLPVLSEYEPIFPSKEDFNGAQDAILRLQETFSLSPNEIVEGISTNAPPVSKLEVNDAFDLGKKAYSKSQHDVTAPWMSEALRLLDIKRFSDQTILPSRFDVLDHLAWSEYVNLNFVSAYQYTTEMLQLQPNNTRVANNGKLFKKYLQSLNISMATISELHQKRVEEQRTKRYTVPRKRKKFYKFYYTEDEDALERYLAEKKRSQELCRGETDPIPKRFTCKLVCFYKMDHPLLILKPAKVERLYPQPELLMFRGAMSDSEINRVKELAHPMLQRATVHNPATGKLESADYRISKSAWLDEYDDALVDVMNRRIEAYTGLDMETAEKLQVSNYGIGGHYDTHFDFSRTVSLKPPPWKHRLDYTMRGDSNVNEAVKQDGNRIATALFYMSNVERGGATVFTNIGQAVQPSKGDAVFWYNLNHDGSGDYDTRHAACPVLIGEKWVSNRWIHERGQEFRRPCRLKPDEDR